MKRLSSVGQLQKSIRSLKQKKRLIGFVPTMGALHEGHLSLIDRAKKECDSVVVSIFVNPTQFGPKEDFKRYPRPLRKDLALLKRRHIDFVFTPSVKQMYPQGEVTCVELKESITKILCGQFRPNHFQGVATVVAKLFNLVQPDRAYFGQKDYQQLRVIERMTQDLQWPIRIVSCPIVREVDGLAMSSRNAYLNAKSRRDAFVIYQELRATKNELLGSRKNVKLVVRQAKQKLARRVDQVQYFELRTANSLELVTRRAKAGKVVLLTAVKIGNIRLIDNMIFELRD